MSHKCLIIIISWDKFFRLYICLFPQLVDRVFDESLNFRKIPPVIPTNKPPEINGKPPELRPRAPDSLEPRALRRRTWNREDVRAVAKIKAQTEIHLLTCCYQTCAPVCAGGVGQPAAQLCFSAFLQDQTLCGQNSWKDQVIMLADIHSACWNLNSHF